MSSYYREEYSRPAEARERTYVRERSRERSVDRTPAFLREPRREAGHLVLRQRDVETVTRRRSPSPVYVEREHVVRRSHSVSPSERVVDRQRVEVYERPPSPEPHRGRSRSISRVRTTVVDRDRSSSRSSSSYSESSWSSSPSPPPRFRRRPRSASPVWKERETERVRVTRKESVSPAPPPPPPQPEVRAHPVERIEREVITHYTDVDHGVLVVRPPTPQPQPRPRSKSRTRHKDTEIDIYTSKNETEVDIRKTHSHSRSRSRSRHRPHVYYDDRGREIVVSDNDRLVVDYKSRRRAHSAAPFPVRGYDPVRDEAEEIVTKIDSRGRVGEAYHGATRDWTIVDVPPGTERVRMDGAGGASAEVSWKKYSGVRRTRFIPDRDDDVVDDSPRKSRDSLSVRIVDTKKSDRRVSVRPPPVPTLETWTEITMDLVNREALKRMGYPFEQRPPFFYVMQYLTSHEIDDLVSLTAKIRRERRLKNRQRLRDKDVEHVVIHKHKHRHHHPRDDFRYDKQAVFDRREYRV